MEDMRCFDGRDVEKRANNRVRRTTYAYDVEVCTRRADAYDIVITGKQTRGTMMARNV